MAIDTTFLDGLSRFNLIVRKRVTSNYTGARKSIAAGHGMLFKDHRIYAPGDDYRAIDWKVFGRTDALMIKNYEEEKNLTVHILVDASASMLFHKKFDYAAMLGVGHAYLAMKQNDKFQFATFTDDVEVYQSRRGMSQVMSMIDYMNRIKPKGKTDFVTIARKYRKFIGTRSLIILISDFLMPEEEIRQGLVYFSGHEVKLIQVLDAEEAEPTLEGDFRLQDSEDGVQLRTYLSLQMKKDYLERLHHHQSFIEKEASAHAIEFQTVHTGMPLFDAFYHVLR